MRIGTGIVALMGLGLLACASTHPAKTQTWEPVPADPTSMVAAQETASQPIRRPPGVLSRQEVLRVLDRGPQAFLAVIREEPLVVSGQFRGWIFQGWRDPSYETALLHPGDVISRVNGKAIEKPDQFMKAWEELRTASALVIELVRGGQPQTVRFSIQEEP